MLDAGHEKVKLSTDELERLSAWIDLGVPFAGDYREAAAWTADGTAKYEHYLAKRRQLAAGEAANVSALGTGHDLPGHTPGDPPPTLSVKTLRGSRPDP